jgi:hypothetical protein
MAEVRIEIGISDETVCLGIQPPLEYEQMMLLRDAEFVNPHVTSSFRLAESNGGEEYSYSKWANSGEDAIALALLAAKAIGGALAHRQHDEILIDDTLHPLAPGQSLFSDWSVKYEPSGASDDKTSDHNAVRQAAWAEQMLNDGVSDSVKPVGLTPLEMYRTGRAEFTAPTPRTDDEDKAVFRALWGPSFEKKNSRDTQVAWLADTAMVELVRNPELAHLFDGTARDFSTIHELQRHAFRITQDAYTEGFAAGLPEAMPDA